MLNFDCSGLNIFAAGKWTLKAGKDKQLTQKPRKPRWYVYEMIMFKGNDNFETAEEMAEKHDLEKMQMD